MSHPADYSYVAGAGVEGVLALAGLAVLVRRRARPSREPAALTPWAGGGADFLLLFLLAICGALIVPQIVGRAVRSAGLSRNARDVLAMLSSQGGLLAGVVGFHFGLGRRLADRATGRASVWRSGAATALVAFPLIFAVTLVWQNGLLWLGLPVETQDRVQNLIDLHSWVLRALYVGAAVVVAPVTEEAIFRAGLFRYLRGITPRGVAIWASALVFGLMHVDFRSPADSLASLVPLVVLGAIFAAAYERTGRIGTTMVAHGLFNLTMALLTLLGVNA